MESVAFLPHGKNKYRIARLGRIYFVEYWQKTKRRKNPYDRFTIARVESGRINLRIIIVDAKGAGEFVRQAQRDMRPYKKQIRDICVVDQVIST